MKETGLKVKKTELASQSNLYKRLQELIKADSKKTDVVQFIKSDCPSIALAKKSLGNEVVKTEITAHMVAFIDYVGVKNSFTLNHIDIMVQDIMDKYYTLKISEVVHVLKQARTGAYGELYNNINPIKIMTWFDMYFNERLDAAERYNMNVWSGQKQNEIKESASPLFTEGQILGNITKAINKINN
jgi:hypothetical protein